ncbi:hypothetical protein K3G23_18530 [Acinetobacter baumannii]|nr:hypothetical protein [Acinetobacter baumannii]MCE7790748.1 hypothetical protein [Acinetobacter baumannii]MCO9040633.1 hypothetical protein [Acinetobacter baumannii]MDC3810655.1 hypothetical protein [Acinetobacter baumannii]MDC4005519.1 hypothetical protein [Acinetobacter baumannii]MDC4015889.1 hypothetical protein [Acinetobacter baumannii]
MVRKYFGTDGIRGKANEGAMTAETALRVGMAAGSMRGPRTAPMATPSLIAARATDISSGSSSRQRTARSYRTSRPTPAIS